MGRKDPRINKSDDRLGGSFGGRGRGGLLFLGLVVDFPVLLKEKKKKPPHTMPIGEIKTLLDHIREASFRHLLVPDRG